jgi:hypothetical protein
MIDILHENTGGRLFRCHSASVSRAGFRWQYVEISQAISTSPLQVATGEPRARSFAARAVAPQAKSRGQPMRFSASCQAFRAR